MKMKTVINKVLYFIGVIIFPDYITYFIDVGAPMKKTNTMIVFSFYILIGFLFVRKFLTINRKYNIDIKNKKIRVITIGCIILTILTVSFGKNILLRQKREIRSISIIPMGEKNSNAKGNEVWIVEIKEGGKAKNLNKIQLEKGWELRDNAILFYEKYPTRLDFLVNVGKENNNITFVKHEYSGKIKIIEQGKETIEDLYSKEGSYYTYDMSNTENEIQLLRVIEASVLTFLIFMFLCYKVSSIEFKK